MNECGILARINGLLYLHVVTDNPGNNVRIWVLFAPCHLLCIKPVSKCEADERRYSRVCKGAQPLHGHQTVSIPTVKDAKELLYSVEARYIIYNSLMIAQP